MCVCVCLQGVFVQCLHSPLAHRSLLPHCIAVSRTTALLPHRAKSRVIIIPVDLCRRQSRHTLLAYCDIVPLTLTQTQADQPSPCDASSSIFAGTAAVTRCTPTTTTRAACNGGTHRENREKAHRARNPSHNHANPNPARPSTTTQAVLSDKGL